MHGRSLLTRGPEQRESGSKTASSKAISSQGAGSVERICVHEERIDASEDEYDAEEQTPSVQSRAGKY